LHHYDCLIHTSKTNHFLCDFNYKQVLLFVNVLSQILSYAIQQNFIKQFFKYLRIAVSGKEQDFTSGSIRHAVFMLSIPMILEMLMESIFAIVDIFYVSQVSVNAVATIGLTESVITLIYAVAI